MSSSMPAWGQKSVSWRSTLPAVSIAVNLLFAFWLFANAAIWGPDYVGGVVITIPPLLAVVALIALRART